MTMTPCWLLGAVSPKSTVHNLLSLKQLTKGKQSRQAQNLAVNEQLQFLNQTPIIGAKNLQRHLKIIYVHAVLIVYKHCTSVRSQALSEK